MGRSSRRQADDNRARIVEVASGLFRAQGIEAVGIADVMKAAGMTQGGFYKHFSSKEALAAEACAFAFTTAAENWRRVAQDAVRDGRNVAASITDYYLARKSPDMTCPMVALASEASGRAPHDALCRAYNEGVRGLVETFTELGSENGRAGEEDRLRMLFAAMVGSNMLARSGPSEGYSGSLKQSVMAAVERGEESIK
jgi:TetR/AcrR family transcriptional repressor of nem operon